MADQYIENPYAKSKVITMADGELVFVDSSKKSQIYEDGEGTYEVVSCTVVEEKLN